MAKIVWLIGLAWVLAFIDLVGVWAQGSEAEERAARTQAARFTSHAVRVVVLDADGSEKRQGWGLIVGSDGADLYIATPWHVVWGRETPSPDRLRVMFPGDPSNAVIPERLRNLSPQAYLDLAVLVAKGAGCRPLGPAQAVRLGEKDAGAWAWSIGLQDVWDLPGAHGSFVGVRTEPDRLGFDGLRTPPGTSGEPIVTPNGIAAIVTTDGGDIETWALSVDKIIDRFREWHLPVNLLVPPGIEGEVSAPVSQPSPAPAVQSDAGGTPLVGARPPSSVLRVLAIGIDQFDEKAGGLHLNYAVADARAVAETLLAQRKSSLYADVEVIFLKNEQATASDILESMDAISTKMQSSASDGDVVVIFFSSFCEVIKGKYYLMPYDSDVSTSTRMERTGIWDSEFGSKVKDISERGKVLLLFDCGGNANILRNTLNMENVAILTSTEKGGGSMESAEWKHGAFTKALLDALGGAADLRSRCVVSVNELAEAMASEIDTLTHGQQHLGAQLNFLRDVFAVSGEVMTKETRAQ